MSRPGTRKSLSRREQFRAITQVAKLSFKMAPGAVLFKLGGALLSAILPLATTYFAALTTTALAAAFLGDESASQRVIVYVVITGALGLLMSIWTSIDNYVQTKMRYVIDSRVSTQMYSHFLNLDFWRYEDKETSDLYERAQNFSQFFSWIFDRVSQVFSQAVIVITGIVALVAVNIWLALVILIAIIPSVYVQFRLSRLQIDQWNKNVDTRRQVNMIEWSLFQPENIAELRLYGLVKNFLNLRQDLRDKDERERIEFQKKFLPKQIISDFLQSFVEIGSLVWVTFEIAAHHQPIGQFVYVQQVVSRVFGGINGFVSTLSSIDEDIANLFDYTRFMELEELATNGHALSISPKEIKLSNVFFHYPQQSAMVIKDVSLTIREHQHVAIVGENGAGKSTLIKLICGLYMPTKGEIKLDNMPIQDISIQDWHRALSVLAQDFIQYRFATARDNVLFGDINKNSEKIYDESLESAEASGFVKKLSNGDKTYMDSWIEGNDGEKGVRLSGGQWQRLAIARNFYRDAPIVILDEPTSATDALAESRIFNKLFKEKSKTIIVISHRLTTVKKADVIYMMKDGAIAEQGSYDELIAKKGDFYTMFESQL